MSVQTDCEMLSVQAMEAYARKYHVSGKSVVEVFHENQVFEKMMIQRPGGRRDNAPPVPHSPACASCPYKGQLPCVGYCLKQVQEKKASEPER